MGCEGNWVIPPIWGGPAVVEAALTIGMRFAATAETIDPVWAEYSNRCLDVQGIRRDADVARRMRPARSGTAIVESVLTIGTRFAVSRETIDPVCSADLNPYLDVLGMRRDANVPGGYQRAGAAPRLWRRR